MIFGGGGEILGTLMFSGLEVLRLTPTGMIIVAMVITIVAGAIIAGSVVCMVLA